MAPTRRPGKKKKQPKPIKRKFTLIAQGNKLIVRCVPDNADNCFEGRLLETTRATEFHDVELVRATKQINQTLNRIQRNRRNRNSEISFINFRSRLMLVWAAHSSIDNNDDSKVMRALHLKRMRASHSH